MCPDNLKRVGIPIHIWAIISLVMDTFWTVLVFQSTLMAKNQCTPDLTYTWTTLWPIKYFGVVKWILSYRQLVMDILPFLKHSAKYVDNQRTMKVMLHV